MKVATPPQIELIKRLANERVVDDATQDRLWKVLRIHEEGDALQSGAWAHQTIEWLLRREQKPTAKAATQAAQATPADCGVYLLDGVVYVVKRSGKGHNYAARLEEFGGTRLTETGKTVNFKLVYEKGMVYRLTAEQRLTGGRAEELCARYGKCLMCGRSLRAAESVKRAIGPICYGKYFS